MIAVESKSIYQCLQKREIEWARTMLFLGEKNYFVLSYKGFTFIERIYIKDLLDEVIDYSSFPLHCSSLKIEICTNVFCSIESERKLQK